MSDIPTEELIERARHEASEDRRVAALMREPKNRAVLERRADVTDALTAEVVALRAENERLTRAMSLNDQKNDMPGPAMSVEVGALAAEVERLTEYANAAHQVRENFRARNEALAAVITQVRELRDQLAASEPAGFYPAASADAYARRAVAEDLDELLALLDSPNTEEQAECVNCGGPMPGRRPGDVCRDCGSTPDHLRVTR